MAIAPFRILRIIAFSCAAVAAAAGAAVQLKDSNFSAPPNALGSLPNPQTRPDHRAGAESPTAPADLTVAASRSPIPEATATIDGAGTAPAAEEAERPSFDLVRAEGDGSMVVAGRAAPNSRVEVMAGAVMIGGIVAGPNGDFAIILDEPLKPGAYQLTIRSTTDGGVAMTSQQTAVVSIPPDHNGQVLALINEPGEPSRLITVPDRVTPKQVQSPADKSTTAVAGATAAGRPGVAVEAVEVDGRKIFLAGSADPGQTVRARVDDKTLGEAKASEDGRFLIEGQGDITIGDHTVRADLLDPQGGAVIATTSVPFERDSEDGFAAVAPMSAGTSRTEASVSHDGGSTKLAEVGSGFAQANPTLRNVDGAVIIRRGDTLWRISQRVYGYGIRYSTIYLANASQIRDPDRIWPGQVFTVPKTTSQGEPADMSAVGDQATTSSAE
jgi:nucleoid-associated protein YgaU